MMKTRYLMVALAALLATSMWAVTPKKAAKTKAKANQESEFEKAVKLYEGNYLDAAYEAFSKIANKAGDQNAGYAWAYMASIKHEDEDDDQALTDGKNAEGKIPSYDSTFAAWHSDKMGEIYLAKGDTAQAFNCVNKAIGLQPNDGYYYCSRGLIYMDQKQWSQAETDFNKAIELSPDSEYYYIQLSSVLSHQDRLDEALAVMNKAVEKQPKNALTYSYRSVVFYNKDQNDKAMDDVISTLALDPEEEHGIKMLTRLYSEGAQMVTDKLNAKAQSDPTNAAKWQAFLAKAKGE